MTHIRLDSGTEGFNQSLNVMLIGWWHGALCRNSICRAANTKGSAGVALKIKVTLGVVALQLGSRARLSFI